MTLIHPFQPLLRLVQAAPLDQAPDGVQGREGMLPQSLEAEPEFGIGILLLDQILEKGQRGVRVQLAQQGGGLQPVAEGFFVGGEIFGQIGPGLFPAGADEIQGGIIGIQRGADFFVDGLDVGGVGGFGINIQSHVVQRQGNQFMQEEMGGGQIQGRFVDDRRVQVLLGFVFLEFILKKS